MATSITQAKPLLTAAELELFDHSRADPIKQFSAKQLAGKENRCRTLRDKYRDLYRRQTLALRGKANGGAQSAHDANARTQRKAEIMQEMLERFEARSHLLADREAREQSSAIAPARARSAPRKNVAKAGMTPTAKVPAKTAKAPANPRKPKAPEPALSAVASLQQAHSDAPHIDHLTGKDPTPRSLKAPSERAPTYGGKARAPNVNAPLDMVAAAQRGNPVRAMPGNIAIQGHVSANVRRSQGKRDSR